MEMIEYKNIFINNIVGIYGISSYEFLSELKNEKYQDLKFSYIDSQNFEFCTSTFKAEMQLYIKNKKIDKKISKDILLEYCKEFSLSEDILNRKIVCLSSSEKYILYIILNLLFDLDVYIFSNIYKYLDKVNIKKLFGVLKRLKTSGKSLVIFDNINILYDVTEEIYLFKNNKIVMAGKTKDVLTDVDKLIKKGIEVPELPLITYLAKKEKGVKLFYHSDVRDIIKDVYKHV